MSVRGISRCARNDPRGRDRPEDAATLAMAAAVIMNLPHLGLEPGGLNLAGRLARPCLEGEHSDPGV